MVTRLLKSSFLVIRRIREKKHNRRSPDHANTHIHTGTILHGALFSFSRTNDSWWWAPWPRCITLLLFRSPLPPPPLRTQALLYNTIFRYFFFSSTLFLTFLLFHESTRAITTTIFALYPKCSGGSTAHFFRSCILSPRANNVSSNASIFCTRTCSIITTSSWTTAYPATQYASCTVTEW